MNNVIEYMIAEGDTQRALVVRVTNLIKEGWSPEGGHLIDRPGVRAGSTTSYQQTMVKRAAN